MSGFRPRYPDYDVLDKWDSQSWNDQTRAVIEERLDHVPQRKFFPPEQWALLEAIAARIIPQPDREEPIPIVPRIDKMLSENRGPGYRYADMPSMRETWSRGLDAIEAESRERFGLPFVELPESDRDSLLRAVQSGAVESAAWAELPPKRFFGSFLLKQIVSVYYEHPDAWSEIGFGGPASPRGYVRHGLDERDPWEGKEVKDADA